jgi:undecaprenyl-diphosphatase
MTWIQIVVLAIVQGLTEFLPVSSSGHLVLVPAILSWEDQGLAFDVAVHFGSLLAVWWYFRDDIAGLIQGGLKILGGKTESPNAQMALGIGLATLPAAIIGLSLADWIESNLRSPAIIVVTLSGYAVLMLLADRFGRRDRNMSDTRIKDAFLIGCAQALALVPGTSRSGVTITAARVLGFKRQDAARFSFLLSVPVILMASIYKFLILVLGDVPVPWSQLGVGVIVSAVVAYISIEFFMRIVSKVGLLPFALYRIGLAAVILYVLV